jgi:Uma2 family endonuclease
MESKDLMATSTGLLTVEQFAAVPRTDTPDELVDGEVISMPPASNDHTFTQRRLFKLLLPHERDGSVLTEFAFAGSATRQLVRIADVASLSNERRSRSSEHPYLRGTPEFVIDVLSPSNTAIEMNRRMWEAFDGGCSEFWMLDPESRTVQVSTTDGASHSYPEGQEVPVRVLGGVPIPLDAIFSD